MKEFLAESMDEFVGNPYTIPERIPGGIHDGISEEIHWPTPEGIH